MNNIQSLYTAIINRKTSEIRKFIKDGGNINEKYKGNTPLIFAATCGNKKVMECILKNGADVSIKSDNGTNVIDACVISGNYGAIDALKEFGVDFDMFTKEGRSPLITAFLGGDIKMFKKLLECGASTKEKGKKGYGASEFIKDMFNEIKPFVEMI